MLPAELLELFLVPAFCPEGFHQRTGFVDAAESGQNELFGGPSHREPLRLPNTDPWPPSDRLQREYEAIGFFLTGHPLDDYAKALKRMQVMNWMEFSKSVRAGATAGLGTRLCESVERIQDRLGMAGDFDGSP